MITMRGKKKNNSIKYGFDKKPFIYFLISTASQQAATYILKNDFTFPTAISQNGKVFIHRIQNENKVI